jgi:hypothetical protein
MTKIDKKITSYKVVKPDDVQPIPESTLETLHEKTERPEVLLGSTYKIKTPQSDHALYLTINDMVLNAGTEHESRKPYEIFINSKNMEHYQWITALTRVISAIFRKGGEIEFLVEELKGIFDPKGGYYKKGGVFMPSLVAEIGCAIETHLKLIGIIKVEIDQHQQRFIEEKKAELKRRDGNFVQCPKCLQETAALMDGCLACTDPGCAYSKCG